MALGGTHPLVERAWSSARELEDLQGITPARDDADQLWRARPWLVGASRRTQAAVLEAVFGAPILDGDSLDGGSLRICRGPATRFSAIRHDASTESHALPIATDGAETGALLTRIEAARSEHVERTTALAKVERGLPALLGTPLRGWRILLWPIVWWLARKHRAAVIARDRAREDATASRAKLAEAEAEASDIEGRARTGRTRFMESLRALARSKSVRELVLELGDGPLPVGVELIEYTPNTIVDAVIDVDNGKLFAGATALGEIATGLGGLQELLASVRALRVARRIRAAASVALDVLEERVERAEDNFRARIEKLEAMHIGDRAGYRDVQLARLRPQIVGSVHAVIEHASVHLGQELAQLGDDWIGSIAGATASDELKQVIARIESTGAASAHRIADETRILVSGGAAGSAHDLVPEIIGSLVKHGLPDAYVRAKRDAPKLPPIELLPSLGRATDAKLSGSALANLFRSFDSRRSDVREKVHTRIEHLREVASAELLDVEPKLHAAIEAALDAALAAALDEQARALDQALAEERAAIAEARKGLAPLVLQRDRARKELTDLGTAIAKFEAAEPAAAAAAAA